MYTSPNKENVMFRILNTLEEGQRMQQEHNRQMDVRMEAMFQLLARQMGININPVMVMTSILVQYILCGWM